MSVTFTLEVTEADFEQSPASVTCGCAQARTIHFPSARLATQWCAYRNMAPFPLDGCDDEVCLAYPLYPDIATPGWDVSLNVSNLNARHLLGVLGLGMDENGDALDLCGSMDAEDFLGHVLIGLALNPADAGVPAAVAAGRSNVIECGRPAGFTEDRLDALRTLAARARALGRRVCWA